MTHASKFIFFLKLTLATMLLSTACSGGSPTPDLGLEIPDHFQVEVYATNLSGPTQMIHGPDQTIWLAQLNGPENEAKGQVLALDRQNPDRRQILLEGLSKPTGIAVLDGALWLASGRDLLRAEFDEQGMPAEPEIVFEDLPYNGRSNGTLTTTAEGELIYETSGRRRGNSASQGSASLWLLDPADPSEPQLLASGLKNAYAHTYDGDGRLWVTEIGDDPVNGEPPPDELNLIVPGSDYGWPKCFGRRQPAMNYGGTSTYCQETEPAVVVLPARSTPTSLVFAPWDEKVLLVALWGPTDPMVASITISGNEGRASASEPVPFVTGLAHPQSLLDFGDGSLLFSDFETGEIYRIYPR